MRIPPPEIPAVVTLIELSRVLSFCILLCLYQSEYFDNNVLYFCLNESLPIRNFISGKSLSVSFICL